MSERPARDHRRHNHDRYSKVFARSVTAHAGVLILTSAHHWYGAVRFDAPWRAHVIHLAVWIGLALGVFLSIGWLARDRPLGRWAVLAVVALSMLAAVAWLGLYEGGYNHLVKDALFAAEVSDQTFRRLFPTAIYEPPGDWVFEVSGIAQLPLGLFAGWNVRVRMLMLLIREHLPVLAAVLGDEAMDQADGLP